MNFFALLLVIVALMCAPALAQYDKTFQGPGTNWHDGFLWDPIGVPGLGDTVLIPAGLTCVITDPINGGKAQSVDVEATATLGVRNSAFLHLRPTVAAPTALTVDGTLFFKGGYDPFVPSRLVLEIVGSNSLIAAVLTGSGLITAASAAFYGPAVVVRADTGPLDFVWGIEVAPGLTMKGEWVIPMSTDNDGLMLVDANDTMDFTSPINCDCPGGQCPLTDRLFGDGVFRVSHAGGEMWFRHRVDPDALFSAELNVSAGLMVFPLDLAEVCPTSRLDLHDGRINVSGGELRFEHGVFSSSPGGATIDISGGLVDSQSSLGSLFDDTTVTITGGEFRTNHRVTFRQVNATLALTITGAGLFDIQNAGLFVSNSGNLMPITINGNAGVRLRCKRFDINRADVTIAAGTFHVQGDQASCDNFQASNLTLSGGTLFLGGTFDGTFSSSVTISGGLLDIRGDNPCGAPSEDFRHQGSFSFTGGKIKVAQNKAVLID